MPVNITLNNSAKFAVQFVSTAGDLVNPSSASITLTYNINSIAFSSTIDLTEINSFWTAIWSSVGVDLGLVDWAVASSATTNPAQVGQLRIVDP